MSPNDLVTLMSHVYKQLIAVFLIAQGNGMGYAYRLSARFVAIVTNAAIMTSL